MIAKLRLVSVLCALVAAVIVVWQSNPAGAPQVDARDIPMTNVTTSIKWPVIETTDPAPTNSRTFRTPAPSTRNGRCANPTRSR